MSARKDRHIGDEVGDGANRSDGAAGGPGPAPDSCRLQDANAPPWGRAGTKWAEEKRQRILAAAIESTCAGRLLCGQRRPVGMAGGSPSELGRGEGVSPTLGEGEGRDIRLLAKASE